MAVGPAPEYFVHDMPDSDVKDLLATCLASNVHMDMEAHDFSIGHRGACKQFPEHTAESYRAAITLGAGIVECDVRGKPRITTKCILVPRQQPPP